LDEKDANENGANLLKTLMEQKNGLSGMRIGSVGKFNSHFSH
jgi:hypothetical protein